jgi:hypothetical protein
VAVVVVMPVSLRSGGGCSDVGARMYAAIVVVLLPVAMVAVAVVDSRVQAVGVKMNVVRRPLLRTW